MSPKSFNIIELFDVSGVNKLLFYFWTMSDDLKE